MNEAKDKVRVLGDKAIKSLVGGTKEKQAWISDFIELYQSYFDQRKIAGSIIGPAWRGMAPPQQDQFLSLQPHRLARIYYSKFREWKELEFKVIKAVWVSQKTIVVSSEVIRKQDRKSHLVFWYLGESGKIWDINIDGISMLKTFRDEYANLLRNGVESFLKTLEANVAAQ